MRRLHLTVGEVTDAFARDGHPDAAARPELDDPAQDFIDLYVAPVSVPSIGRSLLGDAGYAQLQRDLSPDQQAIVVFSNGAYSFKGSGYVRGGIFDRIELLQGDRASASATAITAGLAASRPPERPTSPKRTCSSCPTARRHQPGRALAAATCWCSARPRRATRHS